MRRAPDVYLLDRLLTAGVIEARGCERFHLLAAALEPEMAAFYSEFARSEGAPRRAFRSAGEVYFAEEEVEARLHELYAAEADVVRSLPLRPALH